MDNDLPDRLRTCRIILALQAFLAIANAIYGVANAATGWWGSAVLNFVALAVAIAINRVITHPRHQRLKQAARDVRIAELEKELGIG